MPRFNGKLRVYNMRYCPFAQRTMLALIAKDIDYEILNIDLVDKPEWLVSKSIFSKKNSYLISTQATTEALTAVYLGFNLTQNVLSALRK